MSTIEKEEKRRLCLAVPVGGTFYELADPAHFSAAFLSRVSTSNHV